MRCMEPAEPKAGLSQLRRGVMEYCVLALLRGKEAYGFELVQKLSAAQGLIVSEGTIYPLLSRLRKLGIVTTTWQESTFGPPRRYYRITEEGQRRLDEFIGDWRMFRDSVDFLLQAQEARDGDS